MPKSKNFIARGIEMLIYPMCLLYAHSTRYYLMQRLCQICKNRRNIFQCFPDQQITIMEQRLLQHFCNLLVCFLLACRPNRNSECGFRSFYLPFLIIKINDLHHLCSVVLLPRLEKAMLHSRFYSRFQSEYHFCQTIA